MYRAHFGLVELPFSITPDTSYTYSAAAHQEAVNTLMVAIAGGEGFVKITGEVGTGKTLLCRRLLATLAAESGAAGSALGGPVRTAYVPNPELEPRTLLLALGAELGLSLATDADQFHLMKALNQALLDFAVANERVVLCIDEAQAIPLATLETLRLLSNLETEKRKLLQVVLFGQPELDTHLANPAVRQLRQRIAFQYRLSGLGRQEVGHYLAHRLRIAGYRGEQLFTPRAAAALHRASAGTPRIINILAHKALLAAYGRGDTRVRWRHTLAAAADSREILRGQPWCW